MLIARKPWSYHQEPYYLQEPLEPSDPIAPDPEPDRYPVTDPIPSPGPSPSPEPAPFPAPPEPIPEFPPDVKTSVDAMRADYEHQLDARYAAARGYADAILTPEETRDQLAFLLRVTANYAGPHLGAFVLPEGVGR